MNKTSLLATIAEYDRFKDKRDSMLTYAETIDDVALWDIACKEALEPVQNAFYLLTQKINSRAKCNLISIDEARAFAEGYPQCRYRYVPIEQRI